MVGWEINPPPPHCSPMHDQLSLSLGPTLRIFRYLERTHCHCTDICLSSHSPLDTFYNIPTVQKGLVQKSLFQFCEIKLIWTEFSRPNHFFNLLTHRRTTTVSYNFWQPTFEKSQTICQCLEENYHHVPYIPVQHTQVQSVRFPLTEVQLLIQLYWMIVHPGNK